jgi:membrane protease YdiL (CAAX protease family)
MSVLLAAGPGSTPRGRTLLVVLPLLLTPTTALAFALLSRWLGDDAGYVLGFVVYWLWCLAVPLFLFGGRGIRSLFQDEAPLFQRRNWPLVLILALTVAGAVVLYFLPGLRSISPAVILFSPVAIVTGTLEEMLWRGSYVRTFRGNPWLACVYPALGFAVSHLAPELVYPAEGGVLPFVASTFFLGLAYGWVAFRTGSARWTAITHSLIGLLAFGEPLSSSLARLVFG